ncbi:MAG: alpha/beta fold hydrolase [Rhodobacteraceae bacterium]|nr:alpha/beta fold hydrolase [Paracoccaceae bacterium]
MTLLATTLYGEGAGTPLLIAHGLFGSARNWRALARHFGRSRPVVVVDMRNHGASFWDDGNSYFDMADDLAQVILAQGGQADVLGHSMGGKAAMVLALVRPELVRRLIVADIAPVAYSHTQMDNLEAMRAVPLAEVTRRSEVDKLLEEVISEPAVRAFLLSSLALAEGGNRWLLNLDALANNMDSIIGFPHVASAFDGPTYFVHGGASDYVLPKHHKAIEALFPRAQYHRIEGAGHWVHAEKPREFIAVTEALLGR